MALAVYVPGVAYVRSYEYVLVCPLQSCPEAYTELLVVSPPSIFIFDIPPNSFLAITVNFTLRGGGPEAISAIKDSQTGLSVI